MYYLSPSAYFRRTVYLSASSSDSGDYPSEEEEEHEVLRGSAADILARRAKAKPLLVNSRGPSVMIGGMTSISLCRRRHQSTDNRIVSAGRGSSSGSGSSSSGSRRRGRRSSSEVSCSFQSFRFIF